MKKIITSTKGKQMEATMTATKTEIMSNKKFVIYDVERGFMKTGFPITYVRRWEDAEQFSYSRAVGVVDDDRSLRILNVADMKIRNAPKVNVESEFDQVIEIDFVN
jgi:hypothetical protein